MVYRDDEKFFVCLLDLGPFGPFRPLQDRGIATDHAWWVTERMTESFKSGQVALTAARTSWQIAQLVQVTAH